MHDFIKELKQYKDFLPKNTIKTLRGQALAGDILGARRGLDRLKRKMQGGGYTYANSSSKLKKR